MKTQVSFFVLLLLLVGLVHEAECQVKTVKYKRAVKGKILLRNGATPVKNVPGSIDCTGIATYVAPAGYKVERVISGSKDYRTNSKGQINFSITFVDEAVEKGDQPKDFQIECEVNVFGEVKKVVTAKGKKDINVGTIRYFPDP